MKKRVADFSLLPGDLVILILSFLPVKSLLRFKCVCKSWYDLFLTPDFISKHIINSHHHRLIIGYHTLPNESGDFRILDYNTLDVIVKEFRFADLDRNIWSHRFNSFASHQRLLGSYNGLVCVADESLKYFAFWNPATRQLKYVDQSNTINAKRDRTEHAFGYDFRTKDYKVMRITPLAKGKYDAIEVYNFYSGSWKNSDAVIPDGVRLDDAYKRPTICAKGIYSTMAYTKDRKLRNYFLFTIDMSNETFILTPLPKKGVSYEAFDHWQNRFLIELKNSVAIIEYQAGPSVEEKSFEIFILNEYGPNGIWTKIYTIALGFWARPLGIWKNEELFLCNCSRGLVVCDLRTLERKKFSIYGDSIQILEYKESLV